MCDVIYVQPLAWFPSMLEMVFFDFEFKPRIMSERSLFNQTGVEFVVVEFGFSSKLWSSTKKDDGLDFGRRRLSRTSSPIFVDRKEFCDMKNNQNLFKLKPFRWLWLKKNTFEVEKMLSRSWKLKYSSFEGKKTSVIENSNIINAVLTKKLDFRNQNTVKLLWKEFQRWNFAVI